MDANNDVATGGNSSHCLVVCDMQEDTLRSLPLERRQLLEDLVSLCVEATRASSGGRILWTGVQFDQDYGNLSSSHRIYGALRRLYEKMPAAAKWFRADAPGSRIVLASFDDDATDLVSWRSQCLPLEVGNLLLQDSNKFSTVTVVGLKTSHAVQAVCQVLCDANVPNIQVVRQAVADDNVARGEAVLEHLIPIYANVVDISSFLNDAVEGFRGISRPTTTADATNRKPVRYLTNCGRGGHFAIYAAHLLRRDCSVWSAWPSQSWYDDFQKSYRCPLAHRIVDFCDEPQFSCISAFIRGREHLDEKEKLWQLKCDEVLMPRSFVLRDGQNWIGSPPSDSELEELVGPWFVKEVNKNGGRAIQIFSNIAQAVSAISEQPTSTYVIQQHVPRPLLANGHKCHVKLYNLLVGRDGSKWSLFTYKTGFWSQSSNPWSPNDLSLPTQVTVLRTHRLEYAEDSGSLAIPFWPDAGGWNGIYNKCQFAVQTMVGRALAQGKLQERPQGQPQFELFSADFLLDQDKQVWLIEFNFTPVLFDPLYFDDESKLTTRGLRMYFQKYHEQGGDDHEGVTINDGPMIADVVEMLLPKAGGELPQPPPPKSKWDHLHDFAGVE